MEEILQGPTKFEELLKEGDASDEGGEEVCLASTVQIKQAPANQRAGGYHGRLRGEIFH